jgi:hypothetical protein
MDQKILIEELTPSESHIISESVEDGKNHYLSGVFMQGGIKNRNNRVYPVTEIARAVEEANNTIAETNGIFGELDHPQTLTINLARISHVITELKMDGNGNALGRAQILETPMGNIAKELIKSGVRMGVSSRGAGQVMESGEVGGFNFVTVDIVATPSAPGALPDSIYESLESNQHGKKVLTLAESVQQDKDAQKYLKKEIEKFLRENIFAKK